MTTHKWIVGDCVEFMKTQPSSSFDFVIGDPPYGEPKLINESLHQAIRLTRGAVVFFMYPEDLLDLRFKPAQICHWIKPVSTKNTSKKYSRFVEAIAVFHGPFFNQELHWSCRTGVFTDNLLSNTEHPFKKPESLIERLVRLHTPIVENGCVLDCFGGSGTVEDVCRRIGLSSVSVELDPKRSK